MNNLPAFSKRSWWLALLMFVFLAIHPAAAQTFQNQYGTPQNNAFTKIYQRGNFYYTIGSDQTPQGGTVAVISYLDANGALLWTRRLDIPSVLLDAVVSPVTGNLFVVGQTLPADANSRSIMGVINSSGSMVWMNSYDERGRDGFTRVVFNPLSQTQTEPFYVLGYQNDPNGNGDPLWDDVVLLTVNETNGNIGWKKRITTTTDDEFARNLTAVPTNGDLLLAGNQGANGAILRFDKTGAFQNGIQVPGNFTFNHISNRSGGGFYAVGMTFPSPGVPHLFRFDAALTNVWQVRLSTLTTATQVWEDPTGRLYVCGGGLIASQTRSVVVQLTDTGTGATANWMRYLDNGETNYTEGSIRLISANRIAFVDGRQPSSGGFGQLCAYASVSDLDLTTCMTKRENIQATRTSLTFERAGNHPTLNIETPRVPERNSLTDWKWQEVCRCTCKPNNGSFTNMTYRPDSGPNRPIACGQLAIWQCTLANFSLSGNFMCDGNNCPPAGTSIPMFWTLRRTPTSPILNSGSMTGAAFNLSISNSSFTSSGLYTLTLGGICGNDTCYCNITIETPGCSKPCDENNCLNFDGMDDFVNANSPLPTGAPGNFSVACWFRNERTMPADGFFYRLFGWTGTSRFELGDQGGTLQFFSNATSLVNSGVNIRDGKWHYVVATYSNSSGTVNVYLDGGLAPVIPNANVGTITGFPANFHIGDWGGGASDPRFWDGCIDEFKVWNTALTAAQASDAMHCSADPTNANLLLHYNFNVGVGGQNNGTLTSLPPVKGTQIGALTSFTTPLNGNTSNWVLRGVSQLPACQVATFTGLEGNQGYNTAHRTKVYNGIIYSLSAERASANAPLRPALISRNPNGMQNWRTVLNITGWASDFVLSRDSCDLLIVGYGPAFTGNNRSWIARVDESSGALVWLRTFDLGQREAFTRILLSDNPANPAFPYVVEGVVNNGGTSDDIVLMTIGLNGAVGPTRRYSTVGGDDEFFKDLVQMRGNYVMAGNILTNSVLVTTNNALTTLPALTFRFQPAGPYIFDVEPSFNERFLYVAGEVLNGQGAFLAKIDCSNPNIPVVTWAQRFPSITSFRKVTVRPNGDIHAIGWRRFSTANANMHSVVFRGRDTGPSLTPVWWRYIYRPNENNWTLGDIVHYNGQQVFYTDGRLNNPAGYGDFDILKVLSDNDLGSVPRPLCLQDIQVLSVPLQLTLTQFDVPSTPIQPVPVVGGTAAQVLLPMRDPCLPAPCDCKYENFAFASGAQVLANNFNCTTTTIFDLPCPGQTQPIFFSGRLTCVGSCQFTSINWTVKDPGNNLVLTGGSTTNPNFNIPITLSMVQTPGVYTIELTGKCGDKECKCTIRFRVRDCPKPCACSPLAAFQSDVNMGFNYFKFAAPSCKFQFTPKRLTACDQVQWKVAKASDLIFTVVGTTVGNAPFQYTFPSSLTQYVVCIDVTRTVPGTTPPQTCKHSRCLTIDVDCSLFGPPGEGGSGAACAGSVIVNGGFTQEAEAGGLLSGGNAQGWDASGGDPEISLEAGQPDANFVRLRGSRLYSDRLYQQNLPTIVGRVQLRFSFRPINSTITEGSELVVRLSQAKQDTNTCVGTCQEIMRFPIPVLDESFDGVWLTAFSGDSITVAGKFLTFHIENPFTDDDSALQSVVDIDDICLRNFNFVSVKDGQLTPYPLNLYPNPNAGSFTIELPESARKGTRIRVLDVTGRLQLDQAAQTGIARQTIEAANLPSGMYFLEVLEEGRVRGVAKFVKGDR